MNKKIIWGGLVVLLFILVLLLTISFQRARARLRSLSTPAGQAALAKQESQQTISQLAKIAILPEEEPTIVTIEDAEKVKTQSAFYKDAQIGDSLIFFPKAQKVYLFRSTQNLLVNVGSFQLQTPEQVSPSDK